jgi:mono/diheme cytochrome c family protein
MNNLLARFLMLLLPGVWLVACTGSVAPAPPPPTPTPPVAVEVYIPDLQHGESAWHEAQCSACHGPLALGGIGPQLASTGLAYDQFLHAVRAAIPPKPAYSESQLPDQAVYDIYAWVRTQIPVGQRTGPEASPTPARTPAVEEVMGMTIWACQGCNKCHGVFAQGSADAPVLAGLNYPVEEELARMRSAAETIPEHSADHISDEVFIKLYEWLHMGCVRDECFH